MSRICKGCPIAEVAEADKPRFKAGLENGLFLQAIQGLSVEMMSAVFGTVAGLTDQRIEDIRQSQVRYWGAGTEEAAYLEQNPELAKAAHDCEMKIQLGNCAIHSLQPAAKV